ncbi:MAG: presqualene diphosphate synthase HpnD [Alphaproteobacteria bacterium]|jgi:phytoene synthase|nr:presqualene diphosphate synthase HpnD [Alphaproteobacteria bacterium]
MARDNTISNSDYVGTGPATQAGAVGAEIAEADPWAHVHDVVRRAGSSFFWAMRILPKDRREAVYAIYAFCREVDDIADEDGAEADKLARLAAWNEEVERLYRGVPVTPTGRALGDCIARFELSKDEFVRLIDAVRRDVEAEVRAPTMTELRHYCRGVAGAVGMLLIRVFGAHGPAAEEFAITLGEALQLTNILRDIAEDAERGRLYLPQELLSGAGIDAAAPLADILAHPGLEKACEALVETAEERFRRAEDLLAQCDRRALRSALVMKDVYQEILRRLIDRGWRDLDRPVRVGRSKKLAIAMRYAFL